MQASAMANPAESLFNHATQEQMLNPAMLLPLPLPGRPLAWVAHLYLSGRSDLGMLRMP